MKNRFDVPNANEFGQLRAKLAQLGVNQSQIKEAIGNAVKGRNRNEIAGSLKDWLRNNYI